MSDPHMVDGLRMVVRDLGLAASLRAIARMVARRSPAAAALIRQAAALL